MLITDYDPSSIYFDLEYDLFNFHVRDEDGEFMVGMSWYIRATTPEGYRFVLPLGADTLETDECEFDGPITWVKPFPHQDQATEVVYNLNQAPCPRLNPDKWHFHGYQYGSDAFLAHYDEAMESMMDEDELRYRNR